MSKKTFINEKGNKISVSVTKKGESVTVSMVGPKSKTTNKITAMEAKILKGLL